MGYTAQAVNDFSPTPYGLLPGVVIHAHMTSQLLSAVQDGRSLLWTWTQPMEMVWLWGWAIASGLTIPLISKRTTTQTSFHTILVMGSLCGGACLFCYYCFLQGGWIPLVPAVMVICSTVFVVSLTRIHSFPKPLFIFYQE